MKDIDNKANFKIIQFVYSTLILGVVAFFIITLTNVKDVIFNTKDQSPFMYLVPVFFILGMYLSRILYNKSIAKMETSNSLFSKLNTYQEANIMRGAPLEAAGLMGVAGFLITSNYYYLIFAAVALLTMLVHFPSKNKFLNIANLSTEEQKRFEAL